MSTVLTNGIIIPDNGNRNWGGDLANNWNILDVNVGYMTDVKNRVTTLENSTAENTANIQINASNISALQTSKQDAIEDLETIRAGATAGATAVQPSALNNYVDLSSEQTISGTKTFSSEVMIKSLDADRVPASTAWGRGINFYDSSNRKTGLITVLYFSDGTMDLKFYGSNTSYDNVELLSLKCTRDGNVSGFLDGGRIITEENRIMLAKNLTGTNIAPGGIVDCGDGNGKLKQWYSSADGTLNLAIIPITGVWKSTSFITISPNDGAIFIKLS